VEILEALVQIITGLWIILAALLTLALRYAVLIAWFAWWLWGVNWQKVWPVLARGAWVPLLLLMVLGAAGWSAMNPIDCHGIPNFWWQLGDIALLVGATFLCGWLQRIFGWAPAEVDLDPPASVEGAHGHGH
jgi:hypothetical protein